LRGYRADTIYLDVCAYYNFNVDVIEVFDNIHCISSANETTGPFYNLWMKNRDINGEWKCSKYVLEDLLREGVESDRVNNIIHNKLHMSTDDFNCEYCGIFKRPPEKTELMHIRITESEKQRLQESARSLNFKNISEYVRFKCLN
jgi:hypothetical protein